MKDDDSFDMLDEMPNPFADDYDKQKEDYWKNYDAFNEWLDRQTT